LTESVLIRIMGGFEASLEGPWQTLEPVERVGR
jgi:hypothetical protein